MSDVTGSLSRTPDEQKTYDFYGGMTLAVAGGILLATSFMVRNPVPLTVRGAIVLFMAAGLAVTFRLLHVKNQQDFYGGMALILLSLIAFVASNDLPGMRGFAFGPGTAPRLFAFALGALSLVVVVMGLHHPGALRHEVQDPRRDLHHRLDPGLRRNDPAAWSRDRELCTIVICAAAAEDVKWRETVLWAVILTTFCSFLFPYGLNLPFQLWPRFY